MRLHRVVAVGASLFAVALSAAACSSGDGDNVITIGSANFPENKILAHLYGGVLEKAGITVKYQDGIGNREAIGTAISSGKIDLVPEYAGNLLGFVDTSVAGGLPLADTVAKLKAALEPKGLTVLDASAAEDGDVLVANKQTADALKLVKISDLAAHGAELTMGGPSECETRITCLKGLTDIYGITFKSFKTLDAGGPLTVTALKNNDVQIGRLFSADSSIKANGFVLLVDDKNFQQIGNVIPEIRKDKATAEVIAALNKVTNTLTTEDLIKLDDKAAVDKQDPIAVAEQYLKDKGLV